MNRKSNTLQMKYYQPFYSLKTNTGAIAAATTTTPTIFDEPTTTSNIQSNNNSTDTQMIFEGIISSGFDIKVIGQYVRQKFTNASTKVFIVEFDEPNYILGTSSSNIIMRSVLQSNQSMPRTVEVDNNSGNSISESKLDSFCKLCRESIQDFVLIMLTVLGTNSGIIYFYATCHDLFQAMNHPLFLVMHHNNIIYI
jgi:hypothetical protein